MAFLFLLGYLIAYLIRPQEWFVLINENSTLIRDSLLICIGLYLITRNKNLRNPQLYLVMILTVAIIASLAATGWFGGAMTYGQEFVERVFIPFLLVSGLVSSPAKQYLVFVVVIAASLLMVFNGHVQVSSETGLGYFGNPAVRDGGSFRITYLGLLSDPNDLGMFFVMTLPALFLLRQIAPKILMPLIWIAILALLYGVFLANSRGTLLAIIALMAFWFWRKYGTSKSLYAGFAASPVIFIVLSSFRTISADDSSAQGRLDAWYAGFQMFASNPIFGVGQHNFMDYYSPHTAHNSLVLAIAELGLVGGLAWVGLLVVSTIALLNIADKKYLNESMHLDKNTMMQVDREALIAKSLLYSFIGFMVSGFFLSRTYTPLLYIYLGLAAACIGRVSSLMPKGVALYDPKLVLKWTFGVTFAALIAIYILMKLFL